MIFNQLQELVSKSDMKKLSRELGYAREKNFSRALCNLSNANSLDEFLERGHFDWCHSSKTLIISIANHFNIDIANELNTSNILNDEKRRYKGSYIYIETNFKRKNESIFMLAMTQRVRYLSLKPILNELYFKSIDIKLKIISEFIKDHYKTTKTLPLYGDITGYKLYLLNNTYSFDTDANLVDKEISEQVAWIKI
ncbi:hypothetical protein ACHJH3_10775 [Campylobacter sp. MOP7]|uniref:hypothetical protein n=1 Tax=Campylobacter canis TaxID=3378588 RepID=UPI00387E732E